MNFPPSHAVDSAPRPLPAQNGSRRSALLSRASLGRFPRPTGAGVFYSQCGLHVARLNAACNLPYPAIPLRGTP